MDMPKYFNLVHGKVLGIAVVQHAWISYRCMNNRFSDLFLLFQYLLLVTFGFKIGQGVC